MAVVILMNIDVEQSKDAWTLTAAGVWDDVQSRDIVRLNCLNTCTYY